MNDLIINYFRKVTMKNNIKNKAEKAYKLAYDFDIKYGECSQGTLYVLQTVYNIEDNQIFKGMEYLPEEVFTDVMEAVEYIQQGFSL